MTTSARQALLPMALIILSALAGLYVVKARFSRPTGAGAPATEIHEGMTLPDFTLTPFGSGSPLRVSELSSHVTLINFWATWCDACTTEMPSIVKLRNAFKSRGFGVVAVNLDENPDAVLPKALKQLGIDFTVYTDPESHLGDLFNVHAIPLTVIINRSRKVLMIENGEVDWNAEEIRSKVERWLSG